jgi:FkbM family methyltransferase
VIILEKLRESRNPLLFSVFINFRSILKNSKIRCKYLSESGVFKVSAGAETRFASVNSRVLSYLGGFAARAEYVGKTYVLESIDFKSGDLVIDCGANMGDLEYYLRKHAPNVIYIGFEPNPHDFICLVNNVGPLKCKNIGLWNLEGYIPFYVNNAHASSSFIEPPEYTSVIRIPASTLSAQFPVEKIRLLKLEAEGAEPEVLQGALPILMNIDYISADVGPERGIEEEETRDYVVNFLTASGFELINESRGHRKIVLFKRIGAS